MTAAQQMPSSEKEPGSLKDTLQLEDVTISLLPFGETFLQATGSVFEMSTAGSGRPGIINPAELINLAPGIHMSTGTLNTNRLVIRGVGSRTPYNTNRIRIYLDDIPLTSGDGISTMEDQDPLSIGRIEIVKGPSSALYGSGLGGVVRLRSPYPGENGWSISANGEAGSFGTFRYGPAWSVKSDRVAASGALIRSVSDGYRENSRYERTSAFASLRYFGIRTTLSMTFSLTDLFAQIPSSLNETDFREKPWKAASNWLYVRGFEKYMKVMLGVKVKSRINPRLTNHLVLFSTHSNPYESRPFNILDDRSTNAGIREYMEAELGKISLQAGMEYFREWYDWQIYETLSGEQGNIITDNREVRQYLNSFALFQWNPGPGFLIDAGVNLNLLNYRLETLLAPGLEDQSGRYSYQTVLSPRLGVSYQPISGHTLYSSIGHGFSAPSLEETLLPEGIINTELKPETGWNVELGGRGIVSEGRWMYDVAFYGILLDQMLVTERLAEDVFTGANAGSALNTGVELQLSWLLYNRNSSPVYNAGTVLGYTFSRNTFLEFIDEGTDYSGNHLPGIPRQSLNLQVSGDYRSAGIRLLYQAIGQQWMEDANERVYKGYQLFHLRLQVDHSFREAPLALSLRGGVKNLFNARYASMILVNAPSFGGSLPRYYYPGPPRRFFMGITLKFKSS